MNDVLKQASRPVITITVNQTGQLIMKANMPPAAVRSMLSQVLNEEIQKQAKKEMEEARRIIIPTLIPIASDNGGH